MEIKKIVILKMKYSFLLGIYNNTWENIKRRCLTGTVLDKLSIIRKEKHKHKNPPESEFCFFSSPKMGILLIRHSARDCRRRLRSSLRAWVLKKAKQFAFLKYPVIPIRYK